MQIANPLYDTVFKFMLEDEQVAKLFLSALLAREIVELSYNPQEMLRKKTDNIHANEPKERPFYSVLRLDFAAKIRFEDGTIQTVLIEIQKANNTSDLMRFRRYLGLQLQSTQNAIPDEKGIFHPIPIHPIYFLGEGLPDIKAHGAVKITRVCTDIFTQEVIEIKDNFIENLTFDALIICANELQANEKTALEKLLSIFRIAAELKYEHFFNIDENDYPEAYRPIIRRLQKAKETDNILRLMNDEDDYFMQFVSVERERDAALTSLEKERKEKEKERKEKETALKGQAAAKAALHKAHEAQKTLTKTLIEIGLAQNLTAEAIAAKFDLPLEVVQAMLKTW